MLQPKPAFDPNKPFKEVKGEKPAFDPNKPFEEVKKKDTPISSSQETNLESEPKTGSSVSKEKKVDGFGLKSYAGSIESIKEVRNQNKETVNPLRNAVKEKTSKYREGSMAWNQEKLKQNDPTYSIPYESFSAVKKITEEERLKAIQDVEDEVNGDGIWNNVKAIAGKVVNPLYRVFAEWEEPKKDGKRPELIASDPLEQEKSIVKKEHEKAAKLAKINKEQVPTLDEETLIKKAKELKVEKILKSQQKSRINEFLDAAQSSQPGGGMSMKDKLVVFEAGELATINENDKIILKAQNFLRPKISQANQKVAELEKVISDSQKNNTPITQDVINQYKNEIENRQKIQIEAFELQKEYVDNQKDLGAANENLDVFKRDYGWFKTNIGNVDATISDITSGLSGAVDYGLKVKSVLLDKVGLNSPLSKAVDSYIQNIASGVSKDLKEDSKEARSKIQASISVDEINNLSDFGNWVSNLVANQAPILALTSTGVPGITAIGAYSTGEKYESMKDEMNPEGTGQIKMDYSDGQLLGIPALYGATETASAVVDYLLLKNAGRVFQASNTAERSLISEGMFQNLKKVASSTGNALKYGAIEGFDELGTEIAQRFTDKYLGNKPDTIILENAKDVFLSGAVIGMLIPVASNMAAEAVKPFSTDNRIQESSAELLRLQKELDRTDITDASKLIIEKQYSKSKTNLENLLKKSITNIESLSNQQFKEIISLEKSQANIKSQIQEIKSDDALAPDMKKQLLNNLKEEFTANNQRRLDLIERGASVQLEKLDEEEVVKLKDKASRQLMKEQDPDGTRNITIDDNEISKRAVKIYNEKLAATETKNEEIPVVAEAEIEEVSIKDKLLSVNKEVFGLDDEKSRANAVIMETIVNQIAERSGKSSQEVADSISFEKADENKAKELTEKGKALFQIIGKNAKLTQNVKDNLKVAREMALKGADAKDIFLTTGWEKGTDGKWKYDMLEGEVKIVKEKSGKLKDIIYYPELLSKYPKAGNIKIDFVVTDNPRYGGGFSKEKNIISVNSNLKGEELKSAIIHEIQHWIQVKEGFSGGANPKGVRGFLLQKALGKYEPESEVGKLITYIKNYLTNEVNTPKSETNVKEEMARLRSLLRKSDFELYQSIAGEVEARNVQDRLGMSPEERKTKTLQETEDISRDEQIILFQGEQGAMLAKDGEFIIYALTDPDVSTPLHEMAHVYEHYLTDAERETILKDAGDSTWSRNTSEHFARGFEKYLADGIAPSPEMKSIFENFKKWMTEIYNGITASEIDINLSPEMKKIFDLMLGEKSNTNETAPGPNTATNEDLRTGIGNNDAQGESDQVSRTADPGKGSGETKVIETKTTPYNNGEFTVEKYDNGDTRIFRKNGVEINKFTNRRLKDGTFKKVKNANYFKILAVSEGALTDNEINVENKKLVQESIDNFIPANEYEHALLAIARGAKVSKSSLDKELGNSDNTWATNNFSKTPLPSVENIAESIVSEDNYGLLDYHEVRNAIIEIFGTFNNLDDVKNEVNNQYQKSIDPYYGLSNEEAIFAYEEYMTDAERSLFESVQAESNLSEEEKLKYYTEQYEKSIKSIPSEERAGFYEQYELDERKQQGLFNSAESNEVSDSQDGATEQGEEKISEKSTPDQILDWLNRAEKNLNDFGRENLSVGIPIVVAKAAIQAMKAAVKAGKLAAEIIQAGLDAVKNSDWYKNLSNKEQNDIDTDFETNFLNKIGAIDSSNQRQTENVLNRAASENISEDDAYEEVKSTFEKSRKELNNTKATKDIFLNMYRNYVRRFTDRQYLSKSLLDKSGLKNVKNLIINAHGTSGKAKIIFENAYDKIYKSLNSKDRILLDEIIQAKRFIAIDTNREARNLPPVSHPNFINKNKSEKFLSKLKNEVGDEKYNDLVNRANEYFKTYKDLLKSVYDNGLINKALYDSMSDIDYQPRVFLQFVTDFNGDLEQTSRNNQSSGNLSSDQIKQMKEGDASSLVLNSEWLLGNSLLSRNKAIAMNNINKRFMTGEFQKAKERFEQLDPKTATGDDARFYKYFKELSSKVIDNPIVGTKESGEPKYKFDKTPVNFSKSYYYIDGVKHEFFLEDQLHESWYDNIGGFLSSDAKEFISYASGSAIVKAIATGNNPAFPIVNTPRDFLFTATFSQEYSKIVPKALIQVAKDVVNSVREIGKPGSDVLKKYIEYGGAMDFLSSEGKLKKNSMLGKVLEKSVSANTRDVAKNVFSKVTLSKISEYSEMMFRIGIFQRSIRNQLKELGLKGISDVGDKQQVDDIYNNAVASARSILDFNQGGSITKDLESIVPYINVAFQGGRVAASALEKDPVGTTSRLLQVATLASAAPIGISLALISAMKADDDDKSVYDIYLYAMEGVSKYQKNKYMNIVTGVKDSEGQYQIIKIAKAQELSPVMSVTDDIYHNLIRNIAGKEKKTADRITEDALFSFNSVLPVDVTSPAGLITRNPAIKATLTYATGYDFFREEPLSFDIGKVPLPVEGITMRSTEDFYKKLGDKYGLSPIRSKGFVESLITSPNTNPFVGILYGGADAVSSDKDMKSIGKELFSTIYKSTGKRIISYTSDFNRMVGAKQDLQKKVDDINIERYKMQAQFNDLAKEYMNKEITLTDINSKLKELDPNDRKNMISKIKDKIRLKGVDGNILDIKYEKDAEAKALMIMYHYGDIYDRSPDSKKVQNQMRVAKGILTPTVLQEYNKLRKEYNKKTPN